MKNPRAAFTLIEVTLALGVASFCLLTVFGLVPVGLNSNQNATQQLGASGIATALSADLRGTPVLNGTTSRFQIPIPVVSGTAQHTVFFAQNGSPVGGVDPASAPSQARYRATVNIQAEDTALPPQGPSPRNKIFKVWVQITWPALADPSPKITPVNFSGSLDSLIALNCN
jgi:uncharacterized protein (TIGR02598 family)